MIDKLPRPKSLGELQFAMLLCFDEIFPIVQLLYLEHRSHFVKPSSYFEILIDCREDYIGKEKLLKFFNRMFALIETSYRLQRGQLYTHVFYSGWSDSFRNNKRLSSIFRDYEAQNYWFSSIFMNSSCGSGRIGRIHRSYLRLAHQKWGGRKVGH